MQQPLQITFRDNLHSEALEANIREKAAKLDQFYEGIMTCRVMIEAPHGHQHQGNLFHVRIDVTVPGGELVVKRGPKKHHAHEDPYVALRDAFDAVRRKLQDHARKQRGKVKAHEVPAHGKVCEMTPWKDCGRIETSNGTDIYFHRNSVVDGDFDALEIGDEVRFSEELGEDGLQASTVHVVGKHHPVG